MPDLTAYPDGGLLAKALQVRLTAVLADGKVVRFETGHPAIVTVKMPEGEVPQGDVPLSVMSLVGGTTHSGVHLVIEQGAPYTVQHSTPHRQATVSWNPRLAYEQWAALNPPPAELTGEEQEAEAARAAAEETAFMAGVAAFLDSITDPADPGEFTVTLRTREGGRYVQRFDQGWLARTLVTMAQAPHVVEAGDQWVIERAGPDTPEAAERSAERLADTVRYILADLGVYPDDERVRAAVTRRLNQTAKITTERLR
jgi:hypothetical protein